MAIFLLSRNLSYHQTAREAECTGLAHTGFECVGFTLCFATILGIWLGFPWMAPAPRGAHPLPRHGHGQATPAPRRSSPRPRAAGRRAASHRFSPRRSATRPAGPTFAWTSIPTGCFRMGSRHGYADERPPRRICLSRFRILRREVTVGAYGRCRRAGRCAQPAAFDATHPTRRHCNWGRPGRDAYPVNCVTWEQAERFCTSLGGRLPSEAEWERAAVGAKRGPFPWGSAPATRADAVIGRIGPHGGNRATEPVGSHPRDRSRFGLLDVVGNVSEWVLDWYAVKAYRHEREQNPRGPHRGRLHGIRGCSYRCPIGSKLLRRTARQAAGSWDPTIGFRCVLPGRSPRRGARRRHGR